jgi:SET domain-containing protein
MQILGAIMLLVATHLRTSSIHGVGLFVDTPVKKGHLVAHFDTRVDRVYSESEIATLLQHHQDFIRTHGCWHENAQVWAFYGDELRFCNHADQPNLIGHGPFGDFIAACDIAAQTELTADYRLICDDTRLTGRL